MHPSQKTEEAGKTPAAGAATPAAGATPAKAEEKKDPTAGELMPDLMKSMAGETRMKGCWKKAYYRGFAEIPKTCGAGKELSGRTCYTPC